VKPLWAGGWDEKHWLNKEGMGKEKVRLKTGLGKGKGLL